MDLWLKRIEAEERDDYIQVGPRRRRLIIRMPQSHRDSDK
jgi:hypothetical protein